MDVCTALNCVMNLCSGVCNRYIQKLFHFLKLWFWKQDKKQLRRDIMRLADFENDETNSLLTEHLLGIDEIRGKVIYFFD